jgi:hypothetical protein
VSPRAAGIDQVPAAGDSTGAIAQRALEPGGDPRDVARIDVMGGL